MIPVMDLKRQYKTISKEIDRAIKRVFEQSNFILGQEVKVLEQEFAAYVGAKYAVGVNSGTDALFLALKASSVNTGDEVITCAFGYIASILGISYCDAKPVLVDVNVSDYGIDTGLIERVITKKTKAILPVHLYGQMCDMQSLMKIAKKYKLKVIEDCAQAHGAKQQLSGGKCQMAGTIGDVGCYSFYPTKNLGAYGDAGMVVTDDENIYRQLLLLRDYGRKDRYVFALKGYNSRLDELQAAILRVKLKYLNSWNKERQKLADLYYKLVKNDLVVLPPRNSDRQHCYHLFVVRSKEREKLQNYLREKHINTAIHYPVPIHLQEAYKDLGYKEGRYPVAEQLSQEVLTIPMFPELSQKEIKYVCAHINDFKG